MFQFQPSPDNPRIQKQTPQQSVLSFADENLLFNKFGTPSYGTKTKEKISIDPRKIEQDLLSYRNKKPYAPRDSENFKIVNDSWTPEQSDIKKDYDTHNSFISNESSYHNTSLQAGYNKNNPDHSRTNHLSNLESKYRNDKPNYNPTRTPGKKNQYGYNNNPGGQGIKRYGKEDPMMELEMKNQRIMQAIQEMDNDDDMPLDRDGEKGKGNGKEEKAHWWRQSKVKVKVEDDKKGKGKGEGEKGFWGFLSKKWGCGARASNIICANFSKENK